MLRFSGTTKDGKRIVGIGLTPENIDRLKAGEPISYEEPANDQEGEALRVIICFGATPESIQAEITNDHGGVIH